MTEKQVKELLKELKEIKEALKALKPQTQVIFAPNEYPVPYTPQPSVPYPPSNPWGTTICGGNTNSAEVSTVCKA